MTSSGCWGDGNDVLTLWRLGERTSGGRVTMETAEILRWVLQLLRRSWRLGRLGVLIDLRTLRQHLLSPPTSNSRINCSAGATVDRAFCFGSSLSLAFGSTAVRTEFYTGERAGWYVASGWGISGAWMKCHVLTLTHLPSACRPTCRMSFMSLCLYDCLCALNRFWDTFICPARRRCCCFC